MNGENTGEFGGFWTQECFDSTKNKVSEDLYHQFELFPPISEQIFPITVSYVC